MKISFFAPSYNRPEKSITQKKYPFVKLVVKEEEAEEYRSNGNDLAECPNEAQGNLCRVRNWILDNYLKDNDCVIILDDDIGHVSEWIKQEEKILNPEELLELCESAVILAKDSGVKMWGINPTPDKGSYREHTPFSFCDYLGGPFQAFMNGCDLRYDEKLPLKEDYDMTLQQIWHYDYILRLNWVHLSVKQSEQEGGCAVYRNLKREKEQFHLLRKKWGDDIVKYDKSSKQVFDYNPILKLPY